jgi:ribulose bisphosphate carboxylase small subunit
MNEIPKVYYINLEYRKDRRLQFEEWITESGYPIENVQRISAFHVPDHGNIGTTMSHIKALQTFLESGDTYGLIFEDDYMPTDTKTIWTTIQKAFDDKVHFDVLMLAYNMLEATKTSYSYLLQVQTSFTASGYIITRDYAPTLIQNLKEALEKHTQYIKEHNRKGNEYCNDVYWMKLMKQDRWYCFYPAVGTQAPSYSDLEKQYVSYNSKIVSIDGIQQV